MREEESDRRKVTVAAGYGAGETTQDSDAPAKYIIVMRFEAAGVVEAGDVLGALLNETEGIFGPGLDFPELCRRGRIGRPEVRLQSARGRTRGTIRFLSRLDRAATAIAAATVQSLGRIGPCPARVEVESLRPAEPSAEAPEPRPQLGRPTSVSVYGEDQLPGGPDVESSPVVILVEGRADVIQLLLNGITNVVAAEGTKVSRTLLDLCAGKVVIAFLDGDIGGDLLLGKLTHHVPVTYVARAPGDKEVEELTAGEIAECLDSKVPLPPMDIVPGPPPEPRRRVYYGERGPPRYDRNRYR